MNKKGSILIILNMECMEEKNFLYMLAKYENIQAYELILAYEKSEEYKVRQMAEYLLQSVVPVYFPVSDIRNKGAVYNEAAEIAGCNALIFLDTCICLENGCLEEMMKSLEEGEILAVQPLIIKFHSPLVQSTGYVFSEKCSGHALQNRFAEDEIVNQSFERSALVTTIMAINRYAFEELGGFRTDLPYGWMGRELTMRITKKGYVNYYNHKAKAYDMSKSIQRREYETGFDLIYDMIQKEHKYGLYEMEELIRRQMDQTHFAKLYVVMNFSGMIKIKQFLQKVNLKIAEIMNYSWYAEKEKIEFEKILPFHLLEEGREYIYFTNNFSQIKDNPMWFQGRKDHEDLIVDLSGNVMKISEM